METKDIQDIMNITCFKSLAFCCDLVKPCSARDSAISNLGLSTSEYSKLKREFNNALIRLLSGKKGE